MSDDTTPQGTPAPPVPAAPASSAGQPPPAAPSDDKISLSQQALNERLARAKRSALDEALKELGVDNLEAAKGAVAKARELEEAKKSEIEKFSEKVKALEPEAKKAKDLSDRLARYADAELSKLTEPQKAAVLAIAGEDKARALDTIEALRPTWAAAPAAASATLPAPAKTTASGPAPAATAAPTIDHKAVYEALKAEHPMKAAQYALAHSRDIYK
jgi:hypothetical protein